MSSTKPEKRKLSKSILGMKFMKKSKEKAEKDREEEEGRAVFASEFTEAMRIGSNRFVMEHSFMRCEDLIIGRLSYHGMNAEIERILELERGAKVYVATKEEADISDNEMAEHYGSLVQTLGKKFKTKAERRLENREPERKKAKFLKPKD